MRITPPLIDGAGLHRDDTNSPLPSWREYSMFGAPNYLEVRNAPPLIKGAPGDGDARGFQAAL